MGSSIYAGASGMIAFQSQINIISNNLANASTTGFKAQQPEFADLFYQTLQAAVGPHGTNGGTNPVQNGLGVRVSAVTANLTQGALNPTGRNLDVAIQGQGYFAVTSAGQTFYTRDGGLSLNTNQQLINSTTGDLVQRTGTAGEGGNGLPQFQTPGVTSIKIPSGQAVPAQATATVRLSGNLDATTAVGSATTPSTITIFDSQGTSHPLTVQFTKTGASTWSVAASLPASQGTVTPAATAGLTFDANGILQAPTSVSLSVAITSPNALPAQTVTLNFGTAGQTDGLTQFGTATTATAVSQDGFASGSLTSFTIGGDGTIQGSFSNGQTFAIAQIGLATFTNPGGLTRVGSNLFTVSAQSGAAVLAAPGVNGAGSLVQGSLEQSNTSLVTDLSTLVVAQNNFTANSDTVRVSNQVLQSAEALIQ